MDSDRKKFCLAALAVTALTLTIGLAAGLFASDRYWRYRNARPSAQEQQARDARVFLLQLGPMIRHFKTKQGRSPATVAEAVALAAAPQPQLPRYDIVLCDASPNSAVVAVAVPHRGSNLPVLVLGNNDKVAETDAP